MLAFYKSIYPHTYHIDDAAMDCHIKGGRELDAFMDAARELLKEGRLSFIRKDVYAYNNDTEFIEGILQGDIENPLDLLLLLLMKRMCI